MNIKSTIQSEMPIRMNIKSTIQSEMSITNEDPGFEQHPKEEHEIVTQEDFDKFVNSLPRVKGFRNPYLNQFQGFWFVPKVIQWILSCQNHFQAQDSDIFLITIPKCGTTWLKALIFAMINRNKHPLLSHEHPLLSKNPHDLVPYLEMDLYAAHKAPDFSSFTTPRFFATHSPMKLLPKSVLESKSKLVYLCRNPKDTFISFWHFSQKIRLENYEGISSVEEAVNVFCNGSNFCGPFWDHVLDCWNTSLDKPDKIFFLTYEELKCDPVDVLRRLADFLGYSFSAEEEDLGMVDAIVKLCSFENLSNLDVNSSGSTKLKMSGIENSVFFRKGEVGDWKNHLNAEMADQIDNITQQKFQGSGLLALKQAAFSKSIS